jgi:hypothetical protein
VLRFADAWTKAYAKARARAWPDGKEGMMNTLKTDRIRDGVDRETIETVQAMAGKYKYGWETEIETEYAPKGLNEDIVRLISEKNGEPEWMLTGAWRPIAAG